MDRNYFSISVFSFLFWSSSAWCCLCKILLICFVLLQPTYLYLALSDPNKEQSQQGDSLAIELLSGVLGKWDALNKGSKESKQLEVLGASIDPPGPCLLMLDILSRSCCWQINDSFQLLSLTNVLLSFLLPTKLHNVIAKWTGLGKRSL